MDQSISIVITTSEDTMRGKSKISGKFGSMVRSKGGLYIPAKPRGIWKMQCIRNGEVIWQEKWENIVTTAGLNYLIDVALGGAAQITTWFVGLVSGATPTFAAGDTSATHAGWTEATGYDEATREAWVDGGVSGGSLTNAASVAQFTMNASLTIGGAFLISNSTKGGTTGTLYAEGDFGVDRSVVDNDVLEVTAAFSVADDGV
jgi:hypothetical protein